MPKSIKQFNKEYILDPNRYPNRVEFICGFCKNKYFVPKHIKIDNICCSRLCATQYMKQTNFKRTLKVLCSCGCGKEKLLYDHHNRKSYYLAGHKPKTKEHIKKWVKTRKENGWFKNPEKMSENARKNFSGKKGALSPMWKGGLTALQTLIRNSAEYLNWRKSVFERDKYTCQECGQIGYDLQVHHIKSFSKYHDLRLEISNGITLCVRCHKIKNKEQMLGNKYGLKSNNLILNNESISGGVKLE